MIASTYSKIINNEKIKIPYQQRCGPHIQSVYNQTKNRLKLMNHCKIIRFFFNLLSQPMYKVDAIKKQYKNHKLKCSGLNKVLIIAIHPEMK